MEYFEDKLEYLKQNDLFIYYDYFAYKCSAGWHTGIGPNDDWHRPTKIKYSRFDATLFNLLPDYTFFGYPIKEYIKTLNSRSECHICILALSLCFDSFKIINADYHNTHRVKNYENKWINDKIHTVETYKEVEEKGKHSALLVNLNGREVVIDTSYGAITDYESYKWLLNLKNINIFESDVVKQTAFYQFMKGNIHLSVPSSSSELSEDEEYLAYKKQILEFQELILGYANETNKEFQHFITKDIGQYMTNFFFWDKRTEVQYRFNSYNEMVEYPNFNMFSLTDDEFDMKLESKCDRTKKENAMKLANYHNKISNINNEENEDYKKEDSPKLSMLNFIRKAYLNIKKK